MTPVATAPGQNTFNSAAPLELFGENMSREANLVVPLDIQRSTHRFPLQPLTLLRRPPQQVVPSCSALA